MKTKQLFIVLSSLLLALNVNAVETKDRFVLLDQDKNGAISETEAHADKELADNFQLWDKDRNGDLSKDEFSTYIKSS